MRQPVFAIAEDFVGCPGVQDRKACNSFLHGANLCRGISRQRSRRIGGFQDNRVMIAGGYAMWGVPGDRPIRGDMEASADFIQGSVTLP